MPGLFCSFFFLFADVTKSVSYMFRFEGQNIKSDGFEEIHFLNVKKKILLRLLHPAYTVICIIIYLYSILHVNEFVCWLVG